MHFDMISSLALLAAAPLAALGACSYDSRSSCAYQLDFECDVPNYCSCDVFDCDPCTANMDCASCTAASSGCSWCANDNICASTTALPPASHFESLEKVVNCAGVGDWSISCPSPTSTALTDPCYGGQQWVYDLINVEDVWNTEGYTGVGVHIRINDDGVSSEHQDFSGKFDVQGSCPQYKPLDKDDDHGDACASIAAAAGNNSVGVAGVAHGATLSSCVMFSTDDYAPPGDFLSIALDRQHVSSNSWGLDACFPTANKVFASTKAACPFRSDDTRSPCHASSACASADWTSNPPSHCLDAVASYCNKYQDSEILGFDFACEDYFDLFVDCEYNTLSNTKLLELSDGVRNGRGGKGVIFVFASGNEYQIGEDVNFEGYLNSRFTISVGSVGRDGKHSSFSTGGEALLVSAPGGDTESLVNLLAIVPTLQPSPHPSSCRNAGFGTSFAAPVVAGVVALLLEANPALGWRDVQGVLASTSQQADISHASWQTNGHGLAHSSLYGFGVVDALAAVQAAKGWTLYGQEWSKVEESAAVDAAIPEAPEAALASTLSVVGYPSDFEVETVALYMDVSHKSRGDLVVELESPAGTTSVMHPGPRPERTILSSSSLWKLTTVKNWGEGANGQWSLKVLDVKQGGAQCVDARVGGAGDGTAEGAAAWEDVDGYECSSYAARSWCAEDGVQGTGWNSNWGSLRDNGKNGVDATQACCACGGGDTNTVDSVGGRLHKWLLIIHGHSPTVTPPPTPEPTPDPTPLTTASPTRRRRSGGSAITQPTRAGKAQTQANDGGQQGGAGPQVGWGVGATAAVLLLTAALLGGLFWWARNKRRRLKQQMRVAALPGGGGTGHHLPVTGGITMQQFKEQQRKQQEWSHQTRSGGSAGQAVGSARRGITMQQFKQLQQQQQQLKDQQQRQQRQQKHLLPTLPGTLQA